MNARHLVCMGKYHSMRRDVREQARAVVYRRENVLRNTKRGLPSGGTRRRVELDVIPPIHAKYAPKPLVYLELVRQVRERLAVD